MPNPTRRQPTRREVREVQDPVRSQERGGNKHRGRAQEQAGVQSLDCEDAL